MLGWSINLFRIRGIQLAVHASFFLLLAYAAWEGWRFGGTTGAAWRVSLVVLFFACVVLHELGHSFTAMRFGVKVPRILLLPIGGMAEFDRIPRKPSTELLITAAGPAVNFAIAGLLLGPVWPLLRGEAAPESTFAQALVEDLFFANVVMGVFNLLPVFPMDGGRILRALLAKRMDYLSATRWAVIVGKVLAVILGLAAIFWLKHYLLGALFLFIFYAGDMEYRTLLRREVERTHWEQWARQMAVAQAAEPATPPPAPPLPPYHGPN